METIGAVILAAGGSTRLGQPKQLLTHRGQTLVRHAASAALAAGCLPTVIVTGEDHDLIANAVAGLEGQLRHHPEWERGIGSSIRAGVQHALNYQANLDALLILVCDQPFVTADLLVALIAARAKADTKAAACTYAGTIGVPALFDRALFPALAALSDEQGAKAILSAMANEIACVEFPGGAIDIDSPADLRTHLVPP